MKFLKHKRSLVGVVAALVVTVGALAYWTASVTPGTGSAATNDTAASLTVDTVTAPQALYPGAEGGVSFKINNTSTTQRAHVQSATITISDIKDTGGASVLATCPKSNFTVTQPSTIDAFVAKQDNLTISTGKLKLNDSDSNQDACRNVTVELSVGLDAA